MLKKFLYTKMNILWVIYILCLQTLSTNSRTSTLWRLNADRTKIVEGAQTEFSNINVDSDIKPVSQLEMTDDQLFQIITSTERYGTSWIKHEVEFFCANCQNGIQNINDSKNYSQPTSKISQPQLAEELSCGKSVNFTYYDHLVGVINRDKHPSLVEPDAIVEFIKKFRFKDGKTFDVAALEKRLRHIKKEKPKSIQLYNQLGNYWRIKGEPSKAIECFRKGLAHSPHNSEILLNLAKVLFHLQYLDDAIYLTRRSLEVTPPEKGAWQQYFTLGEIFKVYGHYHEASMHLRHSLELNPGFKPAVKLLQEMDGLPPSKLHIYTLFIIVCLVISVLLMVIISSVNLESENETDQDFKLNSRHKSIKRFSWSSKRTKKPTTA